jgi:TolB protein
MSGRRALAVLAAAAALAAALAGAPGPAVGQDRAPIVITEAGTKRFRAAVLRFAAASATSQAAAAEVREGIEDGLRFSNLFDSIDEAAFLEPALSPRLDPEPNVTCPNWRQIGADALVQGQLEAQASALRVEIRVVDVSRGCQRLLRKAYRVDPKERRRVGKAIADDVVGAFTGVPGVSDTEFAFVSDRSGAKEIYVMDADGGNARRATSHKTINTFPGWAPDGNTIVYTSYRYANRPTLFLLTRGTRSPGRILRELDGAQIYRGVFDPSGNRLAVVREVEGGSEIFSVARGGGGVTRLTRNAAIDVSPTWSPDGSQIAFVSDRTGAPQVYLMSSNGGNQRRLTFNGSYNTAPAWSPDGKWIAYESRVGGQMDIWLIDPLGKVNLPLVEHPRSDEAPTWSADGRMIAFASARRGRMDVYRIDVNGENVIQVSNGPGNNTNPAWGPRRRQ